MALLYPTTSMRPPWRSAMISQAPQNPESALSRRGLFRAGAVIAGSAAGITAIGQSPASAEAAGRPPAGRAVRPPALKAGDRIRIVAPAYPGDSRLIRGTEILQ